MNAFEKHGITHLSASSLNAYIAEPALWVMERLLGRRTPVGAAANRGKAAEHGVSLGLFDPDMDAEACREAATAEYDRLMALNPDPNREKEREAVPAIVETALAELRQYGAFDPVTAEAHQHKVEVMLDEVPVPLIGYIDFQSSTHGMIVELKTQLRLASEISAAHARQGAIYWKGTGGNWQVRVAYTTPKKIGVYVLEAPAVHLDFLRQAAIRLERFLAISDDAEELAGLMIPNFDSFYWNNPQSRAAAREVYGL